MIPAIIRQKSTEKNAREKRQRACQAFWRSITKNGNRSDGRYRIRIIVRLAKQTAPTVELHFF